MHRRVLSWLGLLVACALFVLPAAAQERGAATPTNTEAFEPLDLPSADSRRTGSGEPGEAYWQQRADYSIRVTLDPSRHRVSGTETITYTNNSPNDLTYLWLQLDQNLFAPGSRGSTMQGPDSRWRGSFTEGGFDIGRVALVRDGRRVTPEYLVDDTRMRIDLEEPLRAEGGRLEIEIDFGFVVPEYGADRMGRLDVDQGTVYEIAQWYPRMYVYDDVDGWNPMPYLGQGEFYLEYGDFDLEITVPRDFIVASTGALVNPQEVLTAEQQRRLDRARRSAETVVILGPEDVGRRDARPQGSGPLTWRFRAEDVRDVAWSASQAFIWDAASWEDVLVQSVYPREGIGEPGNPGWEESTQYVRHSIEHYSERWFRYPYPVATNVAGIVGGMEYPMIVFCSVRARDQALFGVTDHEFGHSWFPMIVGSDERRYAWMDEGFNTFINYYSNLDFYGADASRAGRMESSYIAGMMQGPQGAQPVATFPDFIRRSSLGFLAYRKPAKGLIILREYILGPERFDPAFRAYIDRWAYKHPKPADFFRAMEDAAGENLDWFWRGWFYSTDVLDQAVADVQVTDEATYITVEHQEGLLMPLTLEVTFTDGAMRRLRVPVEAFATSDTFIEVVEGEVSRVTVDPDHLLPDVDRSDNVWEPSEADSGQTVPQPKGR